MRVPAFLIMALTCTSSFANLTSSSLFREMKSTNPGTISSRTAATFSLKGQKDIIDIEQDVSASYLGAGAKYTGEIDINNFRAFYGGKGKGLTSEILFEQGTGTRTDKFTSTSEETSFSTDSTVTNINAAFGLWEGFGIGIIKTSVTDKQSYNVTINGSNITSNMELEYDLSALSAGVVYNLGLDFGFFYQLAKLETTGEPGGGSNDNEDRVGFGVGFSTKKLRAEAGYVRNVKAKNYGQGDITPAMAEFTGEVSLGKIRLGYTGRYFMDGFFLFSGIIYDVLAYRGNSENRLENSFNFSLGDDSKGHSFSASLSISTVKSQQKQNFFDNDNNEYSTETKSKSASISYSYVF